MKIQVPVKEKVTTIGQGGKRFWLYPARFHGLWVKRRRILAVFLILIYFVLPWTEINGHQTILLDVSERKFAIFGLVFWPQDLLIFWFFLAGFLVLIFLITAQWGRLWCGWVCPQTVFLEHVFRKVEIWIEGDAPKRRKLDSGPLTWEKLGKKSLKHLIFIIISSHFANTAICYFLGTEKVIQMTFHAPAANWSWFTFMALVNFLFYANFAWFREQFCIIACPYGRFQSVLLDRDSMIVSYDPNRGEPRAVLRKGAPRTAGDCIDCKRCVAVCPTGIDIRMGLQMECVNCTACMDACDEIMEKIGKPRKLIGYTSLADIEGKPRRFIRPRILAYTVLFLVLWSTAGVLIATKQELIIRVIRPPGASFTLNDDQGWITNHFQIKATNKAGHALTLKPVPPQGYSLITAFDPWSVPAGETALNQVFIRRKRDAFSLSGKEKVTLTFYEGDTAYRTEITLMGPTR